MRKVLIWVMCIPLLVVITYKVKTKLGINLLPGRHTPAIIQELTGIDMKWVDRDYLKKPWRKNGDEN